MKGVSDQRDVFAKEPGLARLLERIWDSALAHRPSELRHCSSRQFPLSRSHIRKTGLLFLYLRRTARSSAAPKPNASPAAIDAPRGVEKYGEGSLLGIETSRCPIAGR